MASAEFKGRHSSSASSAYSSARPQAVQTGEHPKHSAHLTYMHRPPRIVPNLGRKPRGALPKSNVSRVLLYDNVTQQQMLDVKISHLRAEKRKAGHLLDMHRKSFIVRRLQKQKNTTITVMRDTCHVVHLKEPKLSVTDAETFIPSPDTDVYVTERNGVLTHNKQDTSGADDKIKQHPCFRKVDKEEEIAVVRRGGVANHHGFPSHSAESQQLLAPSTEDVQKAHKTSQDVLDLPRTDAGTVKLPAISRPSPSRSADKVTLHMDSNRQGVTRLLHTFHETVDHKRGQGLAKDATKTGSDPELFLSLKTVNDDRYQRLERLLVRLDRPSEGYVELSPSFHCRSVVRQVVHSRSRPSSHVPRVSARFPSPALTPLVSSL